MAIKEIKTFVDWCIEGDSSLQQRREMFHKRKKLVEAQIEELQKTLDTITYKCWYYDTAVAAGTADVHNNIKTEDIPEEILKAKQRLTD